MTGNKPSSRKHLFTIVRSLPFAGRAILLAETIVVVVLVVVAVAVAVAVVVAVAADFDSGLDWYLKQQSVVLV